MKIGVKDVIEYKNLKMINMIDKLLITSVICFTIGAFMTFGEEESIDLGSGLFLIATSLLCFISSIILINCQGKNSRNKNKY